MRIRNLRRSCDKGYSEGRALKERVRERGIREE